MIGARPTSLGFAGSFVRARAPLGCASLRGGFAALLLGMLSVGCASFEGAQLYRSGTQALERGDAAHAVVDLEGAAQRVPGDSEVHNRLGVAYAAAGRPEDAIREFRSAAELDCSNAAAARNLRRALALSEVAP